MCPPLEDCRDTSVIAVLATLELPASMELRYTACFLFMAGELILQLKHRRWQADLSVVAGSVLVSGRPG